MSIKNIRLEVMQFLESKVDGFMDEYLIPVEKIWQPSDFLPNSESDTFFEETCARTNARACDTRALTRTRARPHSTS